jgi:hypothetical protein
MKTRPTVEVPEAFLLYEIARDVEALSAQHVSGATIQDTALLALRFGTNRVERSRARRIRFVTPR